MCRSVCYTLYVACNCDYKHAATYTESVAATQSTENHLPHAHAAEHHVIPLFHQTLALGVAWASVDNQDLPRPVLHKVVNDLIHKPPAVVRVKNLWHSNHGEDLVLKVEGNFCCALPREGKDGMKFCPVIHVVANPLVWTIRPMPNVNEVDL